MAYLLDANVLIEAKNRYYAFDICPGFWKWVERRHRDGMVYSVSQVESELIASRGRRLTTTSLRRRWQVGTPS